MNITSKTIGLRHIALNVKDAQKSKKFYTEVLGMQVEWEPDPKSVYLTSAGQDNLALHEITNLNLDLKNQGLGHFGFIFSSVAEVNEAYDFVRRHNVEIAKEPKQHRDGAYSFYLKDPDGFIIQMIYHPPIVNQARTT